MVGSYVIVAALALVVAILLAGFVIMVVGGGVAHRWSNVLMRYRVVAQGLALLVVCLVAGIANL
jgi:hypothetical protein